MVSYRQWIDALRRNELQVAISFLDPMALSLVWLGTFLVVSLQEGRNGLMRSFSACRAIFQSDPAKDSQLAKQVLCKVENIIDAKGIQCLDRIKCQNSFMVQLISQFHKGGSPRAMLKWVSSELNDREARHNIAIRFWTAIADSAPAIGMVGTIIGLIMMFNEVGDPTQLGAAMALALLTTLYGLILANAIASPIAQRLLRLSSEELKWQRIVSDRMLEIAGSSGEIGLALSQKHLRDVKN